MVDLVLPIFRIRANDARGRADARWQRVGRLGAMVVWLVATVTTPLFAQEGQMSASLAAVFNTAGNLGFAAVRAAYSAPDQPPPQAALDWIVRDFDSAKRWSGVVQSCIAFDATRFDRAAALATGRAPARDIWRAADQLYRDYQVAVRGSRCAFGLPNPSYLEAFFVGGLATGFATARASYFYYPTPLPAPVVAQIRQDFASMRGALPAGSCMGAAAPMMSSLDYIEGRLATTPGQAIYNDMVGFYTAIESRAAATGCAASAAPAIAGTVPPPTPTAPVAPAPGEVRGDVLPPVGPTAPNARPADSCTVDVLLRTTCAAVCQGSTVLLGVVSGGPECQACIARGCR